MNMQYPDVESMICQMIMIGLKGSNKKDIANFMETLPSQDIGGVILYDEDLTSKDISTKNIIDSNQLKEFTFFLQSQFNTSLLIGIDQEGGQVNRLKNIDEYKDFESWAEIGKINEPLKTSSFAKRTAEALKLHGINLNFAPVPLMFEGHLEHSDDQSSVLRTYPGAPSILLLPHHVPRAFAPICLQGLSHLRCRLRHPAFFCQGF